MARPKAKRDKIASRRLSWAREACQFTLESLLDHERWQKLGLCQSDSTLRGWIKNGVPELELPKVAEFFGLTKEELIDPDFEEKAFKELVLTRLAGPGNLRVVDKILCLMAARDASGAVRLLTYFSPDWEADLFININPPAYPEQDIPTIKRLLAARLEIAPESVLCTFDRFDRSMMSITPKETGDKHKARVLGKMALYTFRYCPVAISNPPEHLFQRTLDCRDIRYSWRTLADLKSSPEEARLNHDAFRFLSATWDATMEYFPRIMAGVVE